MKMKENRKGGYKGVYFFTKHMLNLYFQPSIHSYLFSKQSHCERGGDPTSGPCVSDRLRILDKEEGEKGSAWHISL